MNQTTESTPWLDAEHHRFILTCSGDFNKNGDRCCGMLLVTSVPDISYVHFRPGDIGVEVVGALAPDGTVIMPGTGFALDCIQARQLAARLLDVAAEIEAPAERSGV
jgi:hypothetical protein